MSEAERNEDRLYRCVMRLRRYNEWRRGSDIDQPDHKQIGLDIDCVVDKVEKILNICTITYETKEQFISRVKQIIEK